MPWEKFVSLELDDEDKIDMCAPICNIATQPDYPWGLRLNLTEKELKKLAIDDMPEIGAYIEFRAVARVTSVSMNQTDSGDRRNIELQVEEIALESDE